MASRGEAVRQELVPGSVPAAGGGRVVQHPDENP